MDNISVEQKALLSLLGRNLFSVSGEIDSEVDWKAVAKEAKAQTVFSVAFNNYKNLPIGEELKEKIRSLLLKYAISNAACFRDHTYLHNLMQKNGIKYCAVKGAASAAFYPDPIQRSMGDVDFYVHPDDINRALEVFRAEGFEIDSNNHPCHIVMRKGKSHFEMHFKPVAYREGWVGDVIEEYWGDIRETARLYESDLSVFYGPSVFHHGFILLTHLQHHLLHEGVGLRHFCDWALFANSLSNEEFNNLFESRLKRIGLLRLAQLLSLGAVKYMGMEYKEWMGEDFDTADEILEDIIVGGNFGKKDRQRVYEGLFISSRTSGEMKKGRLYQIFGSLNGIVDLKWRLAKKIWLLYPIGWVYFSIRYLVRVISGKRKLNLIDTYRKSGKRKKKYSKVKIFDPEE